MCTCAPDTLAHLASRFWERMEADATAHQLQLEEEEWSDEPEAGGLIGALRALTGDDV
jgi:hypothetical protein